MQGRFARVFSWFALPLVMLSFSIALLSDSTEPVHLHATVIDSGSTNRPGLHLTIDGEGHAAVATQSGPVQKIDLPTTLGKKLMQDLEAAGPLDSLPAAHCAKSVSFGSSTYVEFGGQRSPDLSCPAAANPHVQALQKDAHDILQAARTAANIPLSRRTLTAPAPRHQ